MNKSDATDDCVDVEEYDDADDDVDCLEDNVVGDDSDFDKIDVTEGILAFGECDETDDNADNVSDIRDRDAASNNGDFELKTSLRCVISGPLSNLFLLTVRSV